MKRIISFGASSSSTSINKQFANWAINQLTDYETELLDLNDFEMPLFSVDKEKQGIPQLAYKFKDILRQADGVIISFAEHNGSYSTAFKNVFDWMSRLEKPIWMEKPMLLLATSPGVRGGKSVLGTAESSFPRQGAQVIGSFSLPSFNQNFDGEKGIVDEVLKNEFFNQLELFKNKIN